MGEHDGADAGFGVHHEAFGQVHADVFGAEQLEQPCLVFQVGAGRVAEAVAAACGIALSSGRASSCRRGRGSPSLRECGGAAIRRRLRRSRSPATGWRGISRTRRVLVFLGALAHALARAHDEYGDGVAGPVLRRAARSRPGTGRPRGAAGGSWNCAPDGRCLPGSNIRTAFPSPSTSKNCHTARTFMNFAASALTSSMILLSSSALGSRSASARSKLPLKPMCLT